MRVTWKSCLVCSFPDQAVQFKLARDFVLCSWARHLILTVAGAGKFNAGGNTAMDWHPIQGGVKIVLVTSCYGNWDKLWPADGPLDS